MSATRYGFTRASALGPIADFVDHQGGSITRLMRDVDLPMEILDNPDTPVPLADQFRLLERGARQTGDPHFGARLGQNVSIKKLSAFGKWVSEAETLEMAIDRSNRGINKYLQTATALKLERFGKISRWSIDFLSPKSGGRYQNELLALSYLIDAVRCFSGKSWAPNHVRTTATRPKEKGNLEQLFHADVTTANSVSAIEFDHDLLKARPPSHQTQAAPPSIYINTAVPAAGDILGTIDAVTALSILNGHPRIDWVAAKLGMTRRSLQRCLEAHGTNFSDRLNQIRKNLSADFLRNTEDPIIDIALRLGYRDPAHFTRAFKRWTGQTPSQWRQNR